MPDLFAPIINILLGLERDYLKRELDGTDRKILKDYENMDKAIYTEWPD